MCGQKNIADMLIHNNLQILVVLNSCAIVTMHIKILSQTQCDIRYILFGLHNNLEAVNCSRTRGL